MGQAKRRGTREERAAQSAERKRAALDKQNQELKARQDAYRAAHPEVVERPRRRHLPLFIGAAIAASLTSIPTRRQHGW